MHELEEKLDLLVSLVRLLAGSFNNLNESWNVCQSYKI
jgi:hypothetical protein